MVLINQLSQTFNKLLIDLSPSTDRSTKHLSVWQAVTNPVCGLPPDCHQRSPFYRIDSCTTLHITHGLQFPSYIALTTHTQLIALITCSHLRTITQTYIYHGLPITYGRVLYSVYHSPSNSYSTEPT